MCTSHLVRPWSSGLELSPENLRRVWIFPINDIHVIYMGMRTWIGLVIPGKTGCYWSWEKMFQNSSLSRRLMVQRKHKKSTPSFKSKFWQWKQATRQYQTILKTYHQTLTIILEHHNNVVCWKSGKVLFLIPLTERFGTITASKVVMSLSEVVMYTSELQDHEDHIDEFSCYQLEGLRALAVATWVQAAVDLLYICLCGY